jgi:hypothetical protein
MWQERYESLKEWLRPRVASALELPQWLGQHEPGYPGLAGEVR